MVRIVTAALLALALPTIAAAEEAPAGFVPGNLGSLYKLDPAINGGNSGAKAGDKFEIVASLRVSPVNRGGTFLLPNGNPSARVELWLGEDGIATLRDKCPDYMACIARYAVEVTGRQDAYGLPIVKLLSYRR